MFVRRPAVPLTAFASARIDRHRRLTITTAYVAELRPVIGVPVGCTVELEWGERVMVDHVAEIARFNVTPWEGIGR